LHEAVGKVRKSIGALKSAPLLGGWQEALRDSITESEEGHYLRGVKLKSSVRRREKHHLFVTDKRDCEAICNEVVDSLDEFLRQRFSIDDNVNVNVNRGFI